MPWLRALNALPIYGGAPTTELSTDVALGVAISVRTRGRIARLACGRSNPCSARISAAIENLLAEALTLTALLGAPLKELEGQLTLQCADGRRSRRPAGLRLPRRRIRGYVRHDEDRPRTCRTADAAGPVRKGYLAITFDQPVANERYQVIVPLEGKRARRGRPELFRAVGTDPEPWWWLAAAKRGDSWFAGGLLLQHLPEAKKGAMGRRGLDHPDWPPCRSSADR